MDHKVIESMLIKACTDGPFTAFSKLIKVKWTGEFIDTYANNIRRVPELSGFMGRNVKKIIKLAFAHGSIAL